MSIDITNQEAIRKITWEDLVADAVERKDKDALRWLEDKSTETVSRKRADGTTYEVNVSIVAVRAEYLRKYLGYEPIGKRNSEAAKAKKRAQREEKRAAMFAEAFNLLR